MDLAPTVLDLLGLPPIHGVDGESLLPLMAGTAARLPRDGLFTEAESEAGLGWVDLVAVHTRTHSCIRAVRRGADECWDRRLDPWQRLTPLPPDDASSGVQEARDALTRFIAARPAPGVEPASTVAETPPPAPVDAERLEQLRALGYVE